MKMIIALAILILLSIIVLAAVTLTKFSNDLQAENITFDQSENITRYFKLFNNSNVTIATLDIRGYQPLIYQETYDEINASGAWNTHHGSSLAYDGNWGTRSNLDGNPGDSVQLLLNYTKKTEATGAIWQIRYFGNDFNDNRRDESKNLSIPSDCFDQYSDKISLKLNATYELNESSNNIALYNFSCYNGSWKQIGSDNYTGSPTIYEEAVYWNISTFPQNMTIDMANDTSNEYSCELLEKDHCTEITINNTQSERMIIGRTGNETRYINLPYFANVTSAVSDLEGIEYGFCYQETANKSTSCGGLSTGAYGTDGGWSFYAQVWDEDWTTFGWHNGNTSGAKFYVNYTKPSISINTSVWQIKGWNSSTYSKNLTIPQGCWDVSPLQFRIFSNTTNAHWSKYSCYNTSSQWDLLLELTDLGEHIYEEAMWWNLSESKYPSNLTIDVGSDTNDDYTNSTLDGNVSIDLNTTAINNWLETNCNEGFCDVPLVITSDTNGILEYSNINITYNNLTIDLNKTLINNEIKACSCTGCSFDDENYTYPLCTFPITFSSETMGNLEITNINITFNDLEPAEISHAFENYTQTVNKGANYSFTMEVSHEYDPDINQSSTYNISFSGNNSNSTVSTQHNQIFIDEESSNSSVIHLNISDTATAGTYNFNVTVMNIETKNEYYFPVYLTIASQGANIELNDTSVWTVSQDSNDVFSRPYNISNTGNYNATNCTAKVEGDLNSRLAKISFNLTTQNSTVQDIIFTNIGAGTYTDQWLYIECIGTSDNKTVHSPYVELNFTISEAPADPDSPGGGDTPEPPEEELPDEIPIPLGGGGVNFGRFFESLKPVFFKAFTDPYKSITEFGEVTEEFTTEAIITAIVFAALIFLGVSSSKKKKK